MNRYSARVRIFAACASAVAGFVDAVGFIATGGFFVSFMSGNTTRMGVGFASHGHHGVVAATLILIFVIGVATGSLVGATAVHDRRRRQAVLAFVATLLTAAVLLDRHDLPALALGAMALAMGAENALFEQDGEVRIGLTYMTGTLVKLGQRLAGALRGGDPWAWTAYLVQWLSLAAGALVGAACYPAFGIAALWLPIFALILLAVAAPLADDR